MKWRSRLCLHAELTEGYIHSSHSLKSLSSIQPILLFILPAVSLLLPNFTRLVCVRARGALADRHFGARSKNSQDLQASCQSIALNEGDIITTIKAVMTGSLSFTPSLSSILWFVLCESKGGQGPALCHTEVCYYSSSFYRWKLLLIQKNREGTGQIFSLALWTISPNPQAFYVLYTALSRRQDFLCIPSHFSACLLWTAFQCT
jgi:hypothetical protein